MNGNAILNSLQKSGRGRRKGINVVANTDSNKQARNCSTEDEAGRYNSVEAEPGIETLAFSSHVAICGTRRACCRLLSVHEAPCKRSLWLGTRRRLHLSVSRFM